MSVKTIFTGKNLEFKGYPMPVTARNPLKVGQIIHDPCRGGWMQIEICKPRMSCMRVSVLSHIGLPFEVKRAPSDVSIGECYQFNLNPGNVVIYTTWGINKKSLVEEMRCYVLRYESQNEHQNNYQVLATYCADFDGMFSFVMLKEWTSKISDSKIRKAVKNDIRRVLTGFDAEDVRIEGRNLAYQRKRLLRS